MKKASILMLLLALTIPGFAQMFNPVTWETSSSQDGDIMTLTFKAKVDAGWHLYDTDLNEGGPISTSLIFESEDGFTPIGTLKAIGEPISVFDASFQMDVRYFANEATFIQKVKITKENAVVKGYVEFMSCNEETCTPPMEEEFSFTGKLPVKKEVATPTPVKKEAKVVEPSQAKEEVKAEKEPESVPMTKVEAQKTVDATPVVSEATEEKVEKKSIEPTPEEHKSLLTIFLLAFLAGLAALLTPCVFPMIPMTVSFFTKQSQNKAVGIRNATIYGIFIILIYVVLGSLVALIFGADALNALSTNPWFNVFFFALLVVFAVSFLGAFEIVLPSKWVNKADANADKGGFLGSFFMALTLVLVSFSCTGPLVGTLLVQSATEGGMAPVVGMFGFGLALALPFALFAAFPGYLNSLPKSGGWLNSVKVVLGFLELALAFKFLSNADLVLNLHFLEREVFIAIWIAIFGALGFYFLGKIRLPHDSPMDYIPVSRLIMGLVTLSFTIYMIPGLWGAPLKLISAFPPPMEYAESPEGVGHKSLSLALSAGDSPIAKLEDEMHVGPQGIPMFDDYDEALAYAKKVNKPLMIDFTGKACVNCRQMEINVWSDPEVNRLMKSEYVIASLYVDYREKLPEDEQYISEVTGKKIRTVGNKWSEFQISRYKRNSQPYYVLVDHNEDELVAPRAFNLDKEAYADWLKAGVESFKK